ncbi:MAG: hypothetical protein ACHQ50_04845 [Fimbriimonadales bacterium]
MQIGDPKKTVILGIVAFAAIGFCLSQVFGGGGSPKVLRQGSSEASGPAGSQTQAAGSLALVQLDQLHVDPFSHPKLAIKAATSQSPASAPANGSEGPSKGPDGGPLLPGPLRPGDTLDKTLDPSWPLSINPAQVPGGTGPQLEKLTQVTVKAIVKVNQRIAYLSVDGQEAHGYRPGDFIKPDIQVTTVNEDSVIVKSSKATVTLKVGQQGDL